MFTNHAKSAKLIPIAIFTLTLICLMAACFHTQTSSEANTSSDCENLYAVSQSADSTSSENISSSSDESAICTADLLNYVQESEINAQEAAARTLSEIVRNVEATNQIAECDAADISTNEETVSYEERPSSEQTVEEPVQTVITEGDAGGFYIPDLGINVAVYAAPLEADGGVYAQAVVDAEGQAALFYRNGHQIIADHWNQGFEAINYAVPNTTRATFMQGGVPYEYVCVANIQGHNIETDLTDGSYTPIDSICPGAIVLYTCHGSWQNVTLTFWAPQ